MAIFCSHICLTSSLMLLHSLINNVATVQCLSAVFSNSAYLSPISCWSVFISVFLLHTKDLNDDAELQFHHPSCCSCWDWWEVPMILIFPFRQVNHRFASKASGSVMMEAASHISGDAMALETAWTDRMKWIVLVCLKRLQSFLSRLPKSELNL